MIQLRKDVYTKENTRFNEECLSVFLAMYEILSQTLQYRDPYTHKHQKNVAYISQKIGLKLGLSDYKMTCLRLGASIHDIGKIKIPMELLYKPDKLESAEFELIKMHAKYGGDLLKDYELPWPIYNVVSQHHECVDGTGYPNGLKGNEICLEAKIVAVADTYESMSNDRPYRKCLGTTKAIKAIKAGKGTKYDPLIVNAFIACAEEDETFDGLFTIK